MKKDQTKSWLSWKPLKSCGLEWEGMCFGMLYLCDGRVMMAYSKGASLKTPFAPLGRSVHKILKVWSLDQQHQHDL